MTANTNLSGGGVSGTVSTGVASDLSYVESLRKIESDALGFLPKERYASILEQRPTRGRHRYMYERVLLYRDDDEPTGYCYAAPGSLGCPAHVYQICVQQDARRWHRAHMLLDHVEEEAKKRGASCVIARVAVDLEAVSFWQASGYLPVRVTHSTALNRKPAKRGREIIVFRKEIVNELQPMLWEAASNEKESEWSR